MGGAWWRGGGGVGFPFWSFRILGNILYLDAPTVGRMRAFAATVLLAILLSGSLGEPFRRDEVPFEVVERENFDAFAVARDRAEPSQARLVVRVHLLGDAAGTDISLARAWLVEHANVELRPSEVGAPLFLTRGDLSATSGRSTLGATLPEGMAVEATHETLTNCVVAHEVLHFVGLGHVGDPDNMMHPQCTTTRLAHAGLTAEQRARLDGVDAIRATTPRGVQVWAFRVTDA